MDNTLIDEKQALKYLQEYQKEFNKLPSTSDEVLEYLTWVSKKLNKDNNK